MSHARQQLFDALVEAVTGLATTGARVFTTHNARLVVPAAELPCLLVYREGGATEDIEDDSLGDVLMRRARFVVKGIVKEAEDSESLLDTISVEVETAVPRDLGGIAIDCRPSQVRFIYAAISDREIAAVEIEFAVLYRTVAGLPEAAV